MGYPKQRKSKLSNEQDALWYPKTFLDVDARGRTRRYISGPCEVCFAPHKLTWANFSRGNRQSYRFRHLRCAQREWNSSQEVGAKSVDPLAIAERVARRYQHGAKARGYVWCLSITEVLSLIQSQCAYCGSLPAGKVGKFLYTGIDRKNNTEGYTKDNSAPCCKSCNFLKRDMPYGDWCNFLDRVVGHWNGR